MFQDAMLVSITDDVGLSVFRKIALAAWEMTEAFMAESTFRATAPDDRIAQTTPPWTLIATPPAIGYWEAATNIPSSKVFDGYFDGTNWFVWDGGPKVIDGTAVTKWRAIP